MITNLSIRAAKPRDKAYKLTDERSLYVLVHPNGGKYWQFRYRFGGKQKTLAIGTYPDISLAEARERRDQARKLLANDVDPGFVKQQTKQDARVATENTFEAVTREWYAKQLGAKKWTPDHAQRIIRRFESDIFPWIGGRPIAELKATDMLRVLHRTESRGALDTAHRIRQECGQVFRYAVATGRAEHDPCTYLRGALPPVKEQHHASISDPKAVGALLRDIDSYEGYFVTRCALRLSPLVFVRPGELRNAEWPEFNMETAEWRIPAHKMKMRETHIVPLSKQALEILHELQALTGSRRYVFPSVRTTDRPMSENTVNAALRRLGYGNDDMTGHGFRSMASTILNEQGWNRDAIERQLAHAERNAVRAAYNYAEHLPERRKMMQHWADYLDSLRVGAKVIAISKAV